jgi:hypothetical protein
MPFPCAYLELGFKYLGFNLKPNKYRFEDFLWLLYRKIEACIFVWVYRWISRGVKLDTMKVVPKSILVYWMSIAKVPKGILTKIRKKCFSCLWIGKCVIESILLVKWLQLACPKNFGGGG